MNPDEEEIGVVYIVGNLNGLKRSLASYTFIFCAVMFGAMLLAFGLSTRIHRLVSVPILALTRTAAEVTEKREYDLKVDKRSSDEVGQLVDAFNSMLATIREQNRDLVTAKERGGNGKSSKEQVLILYEPRTTDAVDCHHWVQ